MSLTLSARFTALRNSKTSAESAQSAATFVLGTVIAICAFAFYSLVVFVLQRPYFASSCLSLSALLAWYLSKSTSRWHRSQHSENRFWMLIFGWFASASLYMPDSPLHIHQWRGANDDSHGTTLFGIVLVTCASIAAHYLDKYQHRRMLAERPKLKLSPSLVKLQQMSAKDMTLEQKITTVQECLKEVEFTYLPSNIHNYLNATSIFKCERKIIQLLLSASKNELNYLLINLNVRALLYRVRNHNVRTEIIDEDGLRDWGGMSDNQNRNMLIDVLTRQRVSDLSIAAKAIILDSIQVNRLTVDPSTASVAQAGAVNLILKTTGDALSELKTIMDGKGSIQSTHKLVYQDIWDPEIRKKVLAHIQRQANIHAAHQMMKGSIAKRLAMRSAWRKILSDVDDTLVSSGGRYPAGIDTKYKHHLLYPGVIRFFRELDLGTHPSVDDGNWPEERLGNLVFLSARPHVYKDMAEKRVYQKFEKMIHANNLHCMPTLLPGDMESGQAFMLRGDLEPMAQKKIRNFAEYFSIYPEFKHVFVGDNGQADVKAGADMLDNYGDSVEKVFIHQVQPVNKTFGYSPEAECRWLKSGMVFFETYVGAAYEACRNDPPLIRVSGLKRVIAAAKADFLHISFSSARSKMERKTELNHDIEIANRFLIKKGVSPEATLPYSQSFPIGTHVYSPFGDGIVVHFRASDGMYQVSVSLSSSIQMQVFLTMSSLFSSNRKLVRATGGIQTYFKSKYSVHDSDSQLFVPGSKVVHSEFGTGVVRRLRPLDRVLEVNMTHYNAMMFVSPEAVTLDDGGRSRSGTASAGSTGSVEIRGLLSLVRKTLGSPSRPAVAVQPGSLLAVGSEVTTPYGKGTLTAFRQNSSSARTSPTPSAASTPRAMNGEMVKFNLTPPHSPHTKDTEHVDVLLSWGATATLPRGLVSLGDGLHSFQLDAEPSPFQKARSYVSSSGSRVLSSVFRGRPSSTVTRSSVLPVASDSRTTQQSSVPTTPEKADVNKLSIGCSIRTTYGEAKLIAKPDKETGVATLECLSWPATVYMHQDVLNAEIDADASMWSSGNGGVSKVARILGLFSGVFPVSSERATVPAPELSQNEVHRNKQVQLDALLETGDTVSALHFGRGIVLECLPPAALSPRVRYHVQFDFGASGYLVSSALTLSQKYSPGALKSYGERPRRSRSIFSYLGLGGGSSSSASSSEIHFVVGDFVQLKLTPSIAGCIKSCSIVDVVQGIGEVKYSIDLTGGVTMYAVDSMLQKVTGITGLHKASESVGMMPKSGSRLSLSSLFSLTSATSKEARNELEPTGGEIMMAETSEEKFRKVHLGDGVSTTYGEGKLMELNRVDDSDELYFVVKLPFGLLYDRCLVHFQGTECSCPLSKCDLDTASFNDEAPSGGWMSSLIHSSSSLLSLRSHDDGESTK